MGLIKTITLALLLTIGGCSTTPLPPLTDTKVVQVPVTVPIYVAIPPRPVLEINKLTPTDKKSPGTVARAYLITVQQLSAHATELELLLRSVVTPPPSTSK